VLDHLHEGRHVHVLDFSTGAPQLLSCSKQGVVSPAFAVLSRHYAEESIDFAVDATSGDKCGHRYT